MKIPNDLTPFEAISGISSRIRGIPEETLDGKNQYYIPDETYERIKKEFSIYKTNIENLLTNLLNEKKTNTPK